MESKKTNKIKNTLIDTESRLLVARGEGSSGVGEMDEGGSAAVW